MAHYWSEGVSTLRFTAREFQQELVEEGLKHNLLTCPPSSAASFVSLKLIQELAYQIRRPQKRRTVILTQLHRLKKMAFELSHLTDLQTVALSYTQDCADFNKIVSSYEIIVCSSEILDFLLEENLINLTLINLLVIEQCHMVVEDASLQKIMSRYTNEKKQSLSSEFLPRILAFTHPLFTNYTNDTITKNTNKVKRVFDQYSNDLPLDRATILDAKNTSSQSNEQTGIECLKTFTDLQCLDVDKETMEMNSFQYWSTPHDNFLNNDVIVDNDVKDPNKLKETLNDEEELNISKSEGSAYDILECHLEKLEKILCCKADMASDIVGLKRITGKPKEVIIECKAISDEDKCPDRVQLENFMKITALGSLKFLEDHRYDPTEIYGDDLFSDELRAIPDPRTEPKEMLELFLYVLEQAGPYAADKAAFSLLIKIEKLKIKIPYERHFLLLCLVTSTLIQIRAATDLIFEKYLTDREKIRLFSTPKVLRLMDVLKLFKPSEINQRSTDISPKFTKYNIEMKPENPLSSLENKGESLSNAPLKVLKNSHHTGSSEKNNCDIKMNPQNQKDLNSVSLLEDDGKQKRIIEKFNSKEGLESSKDKIIQVTEDIIVDDDPLQIVDLRINSVSNHKGEQNKILNVLDNLSESPLQIKKLDDSSILLNEEIQNNPGIKVVNLCRIKN